MTIYNDGTNSFVWNGTRYGLGTIIKLKDDFCKSFRWNGKKVSIKGLFDSIYIENGKKMFQFNKYCPDEWGREDYPICFSLTELQLLTAIESICRSVTPITEVTACKPPFADKQLSPEYDGKCKFFELKGQYYGSGSKIYVTDEFMNYYLHKTGQRLTKKIVFWYSEIENNKRKYWIMSCADMKCEEFDDYFFSDSLSEEEFFMAIEFITDCHAIKYKDTDEPTIFIFWILAILIVAFSFVIFVKPSAIILVVLIAFWQIRKVLLRQ